MFVAKFVRQFMSGRCYCSGFLRTVKAIGQGSISLDVGSKFATIILRNPAKRNALTGKMMAKFAEIVDELESRPTGANTILLRGAESMFCAGGEFETVESLCTPEAGIQMAKLMHSILLRFSQLPSISVAFIEGQALGGGAELALCCDFRVIHKTARIGFVQSKFNIIPGWGGTTRLVNLLGASKTKQLLLSAHILSAVEAKNCGLVDEIIDDENHLEKFISSLTHSSEHCQRTIKAVVNSVQGSSVFDEHAYEIERDFLKGVWGNEEHLEKLHKIRQSITSKQKK